MLLSASNEDLNMGRTRQWQKNLITYPGIKLTWKIQEVGEGNPVLKMAGVHAPLGYTHLHECSENIDRVGVLRKSQ